MPRSVLTAQQTDGTSACSHDQTVGTPHLPLPANSATLHKNFLPRPAAVALLPGVWDLLAQLCRVT